MTNERGRREELAESLLAEDGLRRGPESDRYLERLLEEERASERRVRRVAVGAWSAVLAIVPLLGVAFFVVRTSGGAVVEVARAGGVVLGILGILALFLAVLTTVSWLLRSRAASLAAIERRLAALERLLSEGRRGSR